MSLRTSAAGVPPSWLVSLVAAPLTLCTLHLFKSPVQPVVPDRPLTRRSTVSFVSRGVVATKLAGLPPDGFATRDSSVSSSARSAFVGLGEVRWLRASRGTPNAADDPEGSLMQYAESLWHELESRCLYLPQVDRLRVLSALSVAVVAHDGQKRQSGIPYVTHPVAVAELLASLNAERDVLIAGLLHETVRANKYMTLFDIDALFGPEVRSIVDSATTAANQTKSSKWSSKWSRLYERFFMSASKKKALELQELREGAEKVRTTFSAMADDSRVILVKVADRLHKMRTLKEYTDELKKKALVMETSILYVPLAQRLGVYRFKIELEDLCFENLMPTEWKLVQNYLMEWRPKYASAVHAANSDLKRMLGKDAVVKDNVQRFRFAANEKGQFNMWSKMVSSKEKYRNDLRNLHDVTALSVVLEVRKKAEESADEYKLRSDEMCYYVLSLVQALPRWKKSQGGTMLSKDYIRYPKPNGYRSLHTTIFYEDEEQQTPLEIQIRTREMDDVAEYGPNAYHIYKGEKGGDVPSRQVDWLVSIRDRHENGDPMEFLRDIVKEAFGKRCYVFLRDGELLNLVAGSTALDAAFRIGTDVGLHMEFPEINGKQVNVSYKLRNGDRVNIITSASAEPPKEWLRHAYLRSTQESLRAYFENTTSKTA
eukprot:TRINITY_DN7442_c0_g1_i1.p1 TRINITY_DN7442_c0_g1~~TRINITY_DN7442_c0_g1_i1.p1  ORF type:complete len:655 (+),score=97.73 TRINITY_DN7442_c0_g1_i1:51-2015(+)